MKNLPKFLTVMEIDRLFDAVYGARDRAILETLYGGGLRVAELVGLNVEDLDFVNETARIRGKGRKEREAVLGAGAFTQLKAWLSAAGDGDKSGPVFTSRSRGGRLTTRAVHRIVAKNGQRAGLGRVHPHMLRHSFATHLLDNGCDLRNVQEFLGHASIKTTSIYTHITTKKMVAAYNAAHPRA